MDYKFLDYTLHDCTLSERRRCRFAKIIFNSPPVNAISSTLLSNLSDAIDQAEEDACRAVLFTGAGKTFVAGADISVMKVFSSKEAKDFIEKGQAIMNKIENSHLVTLAAINGFALGGGLELALSCDIRILSDKATVGLPEVSLGVIPAFGGTQRLSRMLGEGNAKYFILTGNHITSTQALSVGIAQEIVPHEQLLVESEMRIKEILSNGPLAVSSAKHLVHSSFDTELEQGFLNEKEHFCKLFETGEANEGLSAFIEKRKPNFSN